MDVVVFITIGAALGVVIAILLAICAFFCHKLSSQFTSLRTRRLASNVSTTSTTPLPTTIRNDSFDTVPSMDSCIRTTVHSEGKSSCLWRSKPTNRQFGILRYPHKEIQTATNNFTTCLGEGSFGSVYKADLPSGEVVAVKVLALKSTQGEREFQTEATAGGGMNDADWDTILDHKLIGNCDLSQVKLLADIAYRCLDENPQNRPSIGDVITATLGINGRQQDDVAQEN